MFWLCSAVFFGAFQVACTGHDVARDCPSGRRGVARGLGPEFRDGRDFVSRGCGGARLGGRRVVGVWQARECLCHGEDRIWVIMFEFDSSRVGSCFENFLEIHFGKLEVEIGVGACRGYGVFQGYGWLDTRTQLTTAVCFYLSGQSFAPAAVLPAAVTTTQR